MIRFKTWRYLMTWSKEYHTRKGHEGLNGNTPFKKVK